MKNILTKIIIFIEKIFYFLYNAYMKKITLICVGNLKEKYLIDAKNEYEKRIKKYFDLKIIEIPETKLNSLSDKEILKSLDDEAQKILEKIKSNNVITLCVEGEQLSSEKLADFIDKKTDAGELYFVIGSSFGLSQKVKQNSFKLSFSKLTFPHQLMRVVFLEQLYRCGTILNGTPYHK